MDSIRASYGDCAASISVWNWAVSAMRAASFSSAAERWRVASDRSKGRGIAEEDNREGRTEATAVTAEREQNAVALRTLRLAETETKKE
jgi:hypothetical protein